MKTISKDVAWFSRRLLRRREVDVLFYRLAVALPEMANLARTRLSEVVVLAPHAPQLYQIFSMSDTAQRADRMREPKQSALNSIAGSAASQPLLYVLPNGGHVQLLQLLFF